MTSLRAAILLEFLIACGSAPALAAADPAASTWHFAVLLDGKPIGEHDFTVVRHGDDIDVVTAAHFKAKAAFIPLYHYDHHDHEVWHNGCLAQIDSRTDDNGKHLAVRGVLKGGAFDIQGSGGAATLPACVKTFAYWDQRFLTEPRLLNSQTGQFQPVTLTPEGTQSIKVRGQTMSAQRFALRAPKLNIDLWYSEAGDWVALASKLESGRTLRYELQ